MFDWQTSLDWNPFEMTSLASSASFGHEVNVAVGRTCSSDSSPSCHDLEYLTAEPATQPNFGSFESSPAVRPNFNQHQVLDESVFPVPQLMGILNPQEVNGSVHSHMAMACHDYTNKLSYTLAPLTEKPELKSQTGSSHKLSTIKATLPLMVKKKSYKNRTIAVGLTGRKGKVAEDRDYLAHGTGIPRYDLTTKPLNNSSGDQLSVGEVPILINKN